MRQGDEHDAHRFCQDCYRCCYGFYPFCAVNKEGRFRYARDPLCVFACGLYALNRWVLKPALPSWAFLHRHLNDVLLIPAALPLVLWLHRQLGLRGHDEPPSVGEIAGHCAVWAFIAEGLGPWWLHRGTADGWDVLAYAAGAFLSYVWWWCGKIPCRWR